MCNLYVYMFDHGVTVISLFFRPNSIYREELSLWRKRFLKKCWLKSQKRPVRRDGQDTGTSWFNSKLGFSKRVQKMAMGARPCPSRTGWIPSGPAGACVVILCSQHENRVHLLEMMSTGSCVEKAPMCHLRLQHTHAVERAFGIQISHCTSLPLVNIVRHG